MGLGTAVSLAAERIVKPVEDMHRAIARPWFVVLGAPGRPVQRMHDAVLRLVYGSIRTGAAAVAFVLDREIPDSSGGAFEAVVNGLWGDEPWSARSKAPMTIHRGGAAPAGTGSEPARAVPADRDRLVVLVHGLMQTERCWSGTEIRPGLLSALEEDGSTTPLAVRYNTGLPISVNGARLSSLLEMVRTTWPRPVESIALVGYSMGGLVAHRAISAARTAGHRWVNELSDVVTIGTPHRGAPLERLISVAGRGLDVAPQTRPLADFLDTRSQGIKDLRGGGVGLVSVQERKAVAMMPGIRHHLVAGVVTSNPAHPVGTALGDLVVRPASSTSAPNVEAANVVVVGGTHHFDLLGDGAVIDHLMTWLSARTSNDS